ncbi:MAG: hypothetical protein M9958_02405 [Chitinophagales bacterium]|nr:hypothetical protein [Chitinophagales bacterium]
MCKIYWKASAIDNLTDARFFNALDEAWIEFVFDKEDKRNLSPEKAISIIEWLYQPNLLASFGANQSSEEIFDTLLNCKIEYASIPIHHELVDDEDFSSLAFIRAERQDLKRLLDLEYPPFAIILQIEQALVAHEIETLKKLQVYSKVFLCYDMIDVELIKKQTACFDEIGIDIPTQSEDRPGWGAVDIYDQMINALSS